MLASQGIEKGILKELTFVAHDIFRVQKFVWVQPYHSQQHMLTAGRKSFMSNGFPLGVRIVGGLQFDAQRCTHKIKGLAEPAFKKAFVSIGDMLQGIAMDHDDRRVHATLMRITQFRTEHAAFLGGLELNRLQQNAGQ